MELLVVLIVLVVLGWLALAGLLPTAVAWILVAVLGTLSLLLIIGNPIVGFLAQRRKENYSWVPFLGGILGAFSLLLCPVHGVRWFAWIPLILDLTFPMFLYAVFFTSAFRSK